MRIETNAANRKDVVKAVSGILGQPSKYILHGKEDTEEGDKEKELEGLMFSRTAVTNSLLTKLIPKKQEAKVPIEQLEKRLQLLSH